MPINKETHIIESLKRLARDGWVPLSSMTDLLGYAAPTVLYQRQHTKNAIPVIRIGRSNRVSEADALEAIKNHRYPHEGEVILKLYKGVKKHVESIRITERGD